MEKICPHCEFSFLFSTDECAACGSPLIESLLTGDCGSKSAELVAATIEPESATVIPRSNSEGSGSIILPNLHLDKSSLTFKDVKLKAKSDSIIKVLNLGGGEMEGHIVADMPWLAVFPHHIHPKLSQQDVRVEVDTGYLRAGKAYSGMVSFQTSGGNISVPINLTVSNPWWKRTAKLEREVAIVLIAAFVIGFAIALIRSGMRSRPEMLPAPMTKEADAGTGDPLQSGSETSSAPSVENDENDSAVDSINHPSDSQNLEVEESTAHEDISQNESATLTLSVNTPDARVSLNGRPLGIIYQGQKQEVTIKSGQHVLQATKEGYLAWERVVEISANGRKEVTINLEADRRIPPLGGPAQPDQGGQPSVEAKSSDTRDSAPPVEMPAPPAVETPNKPTPEPPIAVSRVVPMSITSSFDGKYVMVVLMGRNSSPGSSAGSVEVAVDESSGVRRASGNLPGRPCGITLAPVENIDEFSFRETPGPTNQWGRATVRIRPKNMTRAVRFTINWQLR